MRVVTRAGIEIARRMTRVVHGGRGDYIEFANVDAVMQNLCIPEKERCRITDDKYYYVEYRSIPDNVKVYFQKKTVDYADYKVGFFYVSPRDCKGFEKWLERSMATL